MEKEVTLAAAIIASAQLAKPVVESGVRMLENLLGHAFKVAGGLLADEIYTWRWSNRINILARAEEKLKGKNINKSALPKGFLMPLLDSAGDVEEPDLQELWANLITSATANTKEAQVIYVEVLKQLGKVDAKLFQRMMLGEYRPLALPDEMSSLYRLEGLGLVRRLIEISEGGNRNSLLSLPTFVVTDLGKQFAHAVGIGLIGSN